MTLELLEGSLLLKYETGGGLNSEKEALVGDHLNDELPHRVNLQLSEAGSVILIDDNNCSSGVVCFAETKTTDNEVPSFSPEVFIGGASITNDDASVFHLQTRLSLVSTISNLQINHTSVEAANTQSIDIDSGVIHTEDPCNNLQCDNGVCVDLWVTSTCRCDNFYTGELCDVLTTAHLTGQSALYFDGVAINETIWLEATFQVNSGLLLAITEVCDVLCMCVG